MNRVQASQFVPSMFIAQEPQIPSRRERRNVSVKATLFLIQMRASKPLARNHRDQLRTHRGAGFRRNPDRSDRYRSS